MNSNIEKNPDISIEKWVLFSINMSFDVSLTVNFRVSAIRSWNLIIFASESKADAYLYSTKNSQISHCDVVKWL